MIAIDATTLLIFLSPETAVPVDRATGQPVEKAKERIDFLIASIQKARSKIIIPTPAYSEAMVRSGAARNEYLRIIENSSAFRISPFDTKAALEVADMTRAAILAGDKKGGSTDAWQKVKFDRQIVAIAKVEGVSCIYSDDLDVKNIGEKYGIQVLTLAECPLPPEERQGSLSLASAQGEPKAAPEKDCEQPSKADEAGAGEFSGAEGGPVSEVPRDLAPPEGEREPGSIRSEPGANHESGGDTEAQAKEANADGLNGQATQREVADEKVSEIAAQLDADDAAEAKGGSHSSAA